MITSNTHLSLSIPLCIHRSLWPLVFSLGFWRWSIPRFMNPRLVLLDYCDFAFLNSTLCFLCVYVPVPPSILPKNICESRNTKLNHPLEWQVNLFTSHSSFNTQLWNWHLTSPRVNERRDSQTTIQNRPMGLHVCVCAFSAFESV